MSRLHGERAAQIRSALLQAEEARRAGLGEAFRRSSERWYLWSDEWAAGKEVMTIHEAVQQNIARLTRPEWAWNNFIELHLSTIGEETKVYHGPIVKVKTLGLEEVSDVAVWSLPQDDQWQEWKVPDEHLDFVEREFPRWRESLWQQ